MARPKVKEESKRQKGESFGKERQELRSPSKGVEPVVESELILRQVEALRSQRFESVEGVIEALISGVVSHYAGPAQKEETAEFLRAVFDNDPEIEKIAQSLVSNAKPH